MFSFFFYISQYLEGARNYSPLGVGYAFLPLTLVMFTTAQLMPPDTAAHQARDADRHGRGHAASSG